MLRNPRFNRNIIRGCFRKGNKHNKITVEIVIPELKNYLDSNKNSVFKSRTGVFKDIRDNIFKNDEDFKFPMNRYLFSSKYDEELRKKRYVAGFFIISLGVGIYSIYEVQRHRIRCENDLIGGLIFTSCIVGGIGSAVLYACPILTPMLILTMPITIPYIIYDIVNREPCDCTKYKY